MYITINVHSKFHHHIFHWQKQKTWVNLLKKLPSNLVLLYAILYQSWFIMHHLYSTAASCHTFNLGSKDNFKYQLEENAGSVQYLTTSLRKQLNITQIKTAVASQYIMVQAILQSCFWGSGYVARTLTFLFFKLCMHLIVPSRRICMAKLRAFFSSSVQEPFSMP